LHLGYFALPPSIFSLAATSQTPCLLPRCSRQQQQPATGSTTPFLSMVGAPFWRAASTSLGAPPCSMGAGPSAPLPSEQQSLLLGSSFLDAPCSLSHAQQPWRFPLRAPLSPMAGPLLPALDAPAESVLLPRRAEVFPHGCELEFLPWTPRNFSSALPVYLPPSSSISLLSLRSSIPPWTPLVVPCA
jgi:hypothetical protein